MEIPDIIVVNKCDHPMTETMVREIRGVLSLAPADGRPTPIVKTEALRGEGVAELAEELDAHRAFIEAEGTLAERRRRNLRSEVISICTHRMRRDLEQKVDGDERFSKLFDAVVERKLDPASAATEILDQLGD
jgi:LAO/AO transport system kinase